jgi:hypothetical protein
MTDDSKTVPCQECPDSLVRGWCMDCKEEFAGHLALTIVLHGGNVGIVIAVATETNLHPIARVPLHLIPVIGL